MTPEDFDALLEERAAALARPVQTVDTASSEVVVMSVAGGRRYAVATSHVRGVVRNEGICRLPASAGELRGILLVKGEAVPVADLASILGLSGPDLNRPFAVVLAGARPPVALLVDEVVSTEALAERDLRVVHGTSADESLERGIAPDGVVALDADVLLTDKRLYVGAGAATTADRPDTHP